MIGLLACTLISDPEVEAKVGAPADAAGETDGDSGTDTEARQDADRDGYDTTTDCDDTTAAVNPGAEEICDGVDNNCSGTTDDDDPNLVGAPTWYPDNDGDSFGNGAYPTVACSAPLGAWTADGGDCNDSDAAIRPTAIETCDGTDNDCDASTDEDVTTTYYADVAGDLFGDPASTSTSCAAPAGYVPDYTDCYDANSAAYPGESNGEWNSADGVYVGFYVSSDRGDGSWDYDCDGVETHALPLLYPAIVLVDCADRATVVAAPGCGEPWCTDTAGGWEMCK